MVDNDDYMDAKAYDDNISETMWDRLQEGINANRRFRLKGVAGGNNMRYDSTKVVWDSDIYIYFTRESDGAWVYNKINANPTTGITCGDDDLLYVTLNDTTATVLTVDDADYKSMPTDDTGRILVLGAVRGSRWCGISSTDISHDSILNVSSDDHHTQSHALSGGDHTGDLAYTQLDAIVDTSGTGANNLLSRADHVHTAADGSSKVTYSNLLSIPSTFAPSEHGNAAHNPDFATASDLTSHTGAANPHSSSASDTDLSNHASDTSTHGKTTIAGMEDLHTKYALLDDLIANEITVIKAINDASVDNNNWDYMGALNQSVATSASPSFMGLSLGSNSDLQVLMESEVAGVGAQTYFNFWNDAGHIGYVGYVSATDNHLEITNDYAGGNIELNTTASGSVKMGSQTKEFTGVKTCNDNVVTSFVRLTLSGGYQLGSDQSLFVKVYLIAEWGDGYCSSAAEYTVYSRDAYESGGPPYWPGQTSVQLVNRVDLGSINAGFADIGLPTVTATWNATSAYMEIRCQADLTGVGGGGTSYACRYKIHVLARYIDKVAITAL